MLYILHSDQNAHFFVLKKFATQFFSQAKKIDRQYMFSPLRVKIWESAPTYIGRSTIFSKYGVFLKLKKKHCLPHTHTHKHTHTHTTILHTNAGDSSRRIQEHTSVLGSFYKAFVFYITIETNDRSLLQRRPIKETLFCKRDL